MSARYDHSGRLINADYNNKKAIAYSYDKDGNRISKSTFVCVTPTANFTASQRSGNCPLTVDFTSTSVTNGATTYEWTVYTDTSNSPSYFSQQNPTGVVFNYAGTFLVSLKVSDACGTNTKTIPGYITVVCNQGQVNTSPVIPELGVFPNPAFDDVTIVGAQLPDGTYSIELSDVSGRTLNESSVNVHNGRLRYTLSLHGYTAGTYFLRVASTATSKSFKITKE